MVTARPIETGLALHPNRPNPFNPQTTISYSLPASASDAEVRVSIVDASGRLVRTLVNERQSEGVHEVRWEGKGANDEAIASGVYFCVLDVGGERRIRKLVLLK
jgi:flagellar hook assembly protein FlgD